MIGAIENAILERLRSAGDAGVLGYAYRTLATYPEDWSIYLGQEAGTIRAPAAWVVFAGWSPDPQRAGATPPVMRAQFGLVVMSENARNEQATRHGGSGATADEVGSYQLIEDAAALLSGQSLGLQIGALEIGSVRLVNNATALMKRKVSMLALEVSTSISIEEPPTLSAELDDFETFHVNWDAPPVTITSPLPNDAAADATDHVELEIAP